MERASQVAASKLGDLAGDDRRLTRLNLLGFAALCAFLYVVKLFASSGVVFDFGKEVYHAQELRWFYDAANPPLHTWLLYAVERVLGLSLWSVLALNLILQFAMFAAGFALARSALPTVGQAALAAWSIMLVSQYHRIQYSMTHSLLIAIACPLALWLVLRLTRRQRWRDYAALGLVLAAGLLSKFLFLASFLAMTIALLARSSTRRIFLDIRFVGTLVLAGVLVTPLLLNSSGHWPRLLAKFRSRTGQDAGDSYLAGVLGGVASLGEGLVAYGFMLAIAVGIALGPQLVRRSSGRNVATAPALTPDRILLRDVVIAGLALIAVAILALDVSLIKGRFLHAFLFPLPILAVAFVARWAFSPAALRRYFWVLLAIGLGTVGMRAVNLSPACLGRCHELVPYDRLAKGLSEAGFRRGTILALGVRLGGNLRLRFPGSRVDAAVDPFKPVPPSADRRGQCLIIWSDQGIRDGGRLEPLLAIAGLSEGAARARMRTLAAEWRWYGFAVYDPRKNWQRRKTTWRFVLLPEGTPNCR